MKYVLLIALLCSSAIAGDPPKPPFKAGQVRDDNVLKMKLVWCPPGKYTSASDERKPPRNVQVKTGFWIGKYEVTQKEWTAVANTKPWEEGIRFKADKDEVLPAVGMFAEESAEFAENLSDVERHAGRLQAGWEYAIPTREEWEYACRAGSAGDYCYGNNVGEMNKYAWWGAHGPNNAHGTRLGAHGIGQKLGNKWGIHDIHGNAKELCIMGSGKGQQHVACGGGWGDPATMLKCSFVGKFNAVKGAMDREHWRGQAQTTGLRIVLTRTRKK